MSSNQWFSQLCSDLSKDLAGLQVGVYASGGAPFHHLALATLWGADVHPVRAENIHAGELATLDVLIFPGGGFTAMTGMLEPLGVEGALKVRDWVAAGGMYLGSCAGSFLPVHVGEAYWQAHEEARALYMVDACLANASNSMFEGLTSPGVGTLKVCVSDPSHWLTKGLPEAFELVHYNGPLFDLAQTDEPNSVRGVLKPTAATATFTASEAFLAEVPAQTLLDRCIAHHAFNGIESSFGEGNVVLFGSHPEFGFDVLQLGWRESVRLLANALLFQAKKRQRAKSEPKKVTVSAKTLDIYSAQLRTIAGQFDFLNRADTHDWLEGDVPSFLGRSASALWSEASARATDVANVTADLVQDLSKTEMAVPAFWLDSEALENQDVGFTGFKQLLATVKDRLELAVRQLEVEPVTLNHAYDGFETHPYQIALSSYLSAAGLTAALHLMAITIAKLSNQRDLIPLDFLVDPN